MRTKKTILSITSSSVIMGCLGVICWEKDGLLFKTLAIAIFLLACLVLLKIGITMKQFSTLPFIENNAHWSRFLMSIVASVVIVLFLFDSYPLLQIIGFSAIGLKFILQLIALVQLRVRV